MTSADSPLASALTGRYTIEREIGQGGMATVYLAQDVRHHRRVAVKVLRPELAATLGVDRFLHEIDTAAQFQHPHILPLLDSGEAGGFLYYVMPYVDGESLRARLARRGELPVHEAIKVLIEICDALAYAHERGIVHRDIKPDNVLLSGRHALVTDFGVAKALSEATGRQQLTTAGVALGTPTYMAPEQATGDPHIDHRADIYALGVLAYELVAGKPPFSGRSPQETLAAQVTQRPEPLCTLRPACPPGLESVVMKCLEKRPADRWQTADELLAQFEPLATPSGGTTPTTTRPIEATPASPRRSPWRVWVPAAVLLLAIASALALALTRRAPEVRLGKRVQLTLDPGLEIDPALSPDGKLAAYAAGPLGATRLYVRQVDGGAPVAITAEGGFARAPRWSPDGSRLLFQSNRGLEVIPALGGAPQLVLAAPSEPQLGRFGLWRDATWSPDGRSIAYAAQDSIFVQPLDGGAVRGLARLGEAHSCVWSPNGWWLACVSGNRQFVSNEGFGNLAASSIWIIPAAGGTPVRVTDDQSLNTSPAWLGGRPSLLFISDRDGGRDLYRVALDHSGHVSGAPTRLTTGLNAVTASVSTDGRRLAYAVFTESSNVWALPIPTSTVASVREAEPVTTGSQVIEDFDVAPRGGWLAFDSDRGGTQQIYRLPLAGGEVQQLTSGAEPAFAPRISPDGQEIAYHAFRQGTRQVFVIPAEGGAPTAVTTGNQHHRGARWSPDGRRLMILTGDPTASLETDVVLRDRKGRWSAPRTLIKAGSGGWSPDGRWIVTLMTVGHERGMALMSTVGRPPRMLIPVASAAAAPITGDWSSDGRFLYYMMRDAQGHGTGVWRMPASGGTPRLVLRLDDPSRPWHRNGFWVRDGRFYLTLGDQQSDVWTTELVRAP